jgi:hypothetical protein
MDLGCGAGCRRASSCQPSALRAMLPWSQYSGQRLPGALHLLQLNHHLVEGGAVGGSLSPALLQQIDVVIQACRYHVLVVLRVRGKPTYIYVRA